MQLKQAWHVLSAQGVCAVIAITALTNTVIAAVLSFQSEKASDGLRSHVFQEKWDKENFFFKVKNLPVFNV